MQIAVKRRKTVTAQTAHGINERITRYQLSEKCAQFTDEILQFYTAVMRGDPVEVRLANGKPSLWDLPSIEDRMRAAERLLDRAFGKAPLPVRADDEGAEDLMRKTILEVHWLPKAPDDTSRVIEPEPD